MIILQKIFSFVENVFFLLLCHLEHKFFYCFSLHMIMINDFTCDETLSNKRIFFLIANYVALYLM